MKIWIVTCLLAISGCVAGTGAEESATPADADADTDSRDEGEGDPSDMGPGAMLADVTAVTTTGEPGAYTFSVTIASPDTGCDRYADWWEVVGEDGSLLYRRILAHSHVDEQPFTRSGGPVDIEGSTTVFVRAHMAPGGYGGAVLIGSVESGFELATDLDAAFGAELESSEPLPDNCAF